MKAEELLKTAPIRFSSGAPLAMLLKIKEQLEQTDVLAWKKADREQLLREINSAIGESYETRD